MFGTNRGRVALLAAWAITLAGCRSTPVDQAAPVVSRLGGSTSSVELLETG